MSREPTLTEDLIKPYLLYPSIPIMGVYAYNKLKPKAEHAAEYTIDRANEASNALGYGDIMQKHALFNREQPEVFTDLSKQRDIEGKQELLGTLFANREKMKKLADSQIKELFPSASPYKGRALRSLMTAQEASSSSLYTAFKKAN